MLLKIGRRGVSTLWLLAVEVDRTASNAGGDSQPHSPICLQCYSKTSFYHLYLPIPTNPVLSHLILSLSNINSSSILYSFHSSLLCIQGGVDREDLARPSLKLTEEEEQADKVRIKAYGDVDQVLGRRKNGKSYDECTVLCCIMWRCVGLCITLLYSALVHCTALFAVQ